MTEIHEHVAYISEDIIKPKLDRRQWRFVKLKNEMRVLIISDKDADQSAAAMNVSIGTLNDPVDLPGLAHFCEHMNFMGSKKYPSEACMFDIVTPHGGMTNAYTDKEDTNFHFDVDPAHFKETLDVFAQLFISPLFTESSAEREINAVNNEYLRYLKNDSWRLLELVKSLSKAGHDFCKFMTGNIDSLGYIPKEKGINLRDALIQFHNDNYSPNLMCLAILCKESLDDMTKYVGDLFGGIVNKNVPEPRWPEHPYGPDQLRGRVLTVPVKDLRELHLIWPCEDVHNDWVGKPSQYIGYLLSHGGSGSLLSNLKAEGWVDSLTAGSMTPGGLAYGANGFGFFKLIAQLTEDGLDHVDDIISVVYQYMQMMRDAGPQERIFHELKHISHINFTFRDNKKPIDSVTQLSESLRKYPAKEVLTGPLIWQSFQPDAIGSLMEKLIPENMMSMVVSQRFSGVVNQAEEWYGVEFATEPHSAELEEIWKNPTFNKDLTLPEPNRFIPHDFSICKREQISCKYPQIIKNTPMSCCWYKQGDEFLIPKGCVTLAITSPLVKDCPANAAKLWIFLEMFKDRFSEYSNDCKLANLLFEVNPDYYGFEVNLNGFTDKLELLLERIVFALTTFRPDAKRLTLVKEKYLRYLRNKQAAEPVDRADTTLDVLLKQNTWTEDDLLQTLSVITEDNLNTFITQLFSKVHMELLVYGNFTLASALSLVSTVERILVCNMNSKPLSHEEKSRKRSTIQLPSGCSYIHSAVNDIHPSSCVYNYYQLGADNPRSAVLLELVHQIIKESCFDQLRTKEQLGYIARALSRRSDGVLGLIILVQSHRQPDFVNHRMEAFLESMLDLVQGLSESEYQQHIDGLISARLTKPKNLLDQSNYYWAEILPQTYQYNKAEMETTILKSISKQELMQHFMDAVAENGPRRRKLSIQIIARHHKDEYASDELMDNNNNNETDLIKKCKVVMDDRSLQESLSFFPKSTPTLWQSDSHTLALEE